MRYGGIMNNYDIYKDIATRCNGDIYIGVVGPVRTGKSTFITKVLNSLVLPNIVDSYSKDRTIDEMPQSGDGKSIMTTQPKFIPNEAVKVRFENDAEMNVRMIDCVGYLVDGAVGHIENDKPRMVKTPWSKEDMPFEKAAELGTNKVITEHSTIGVLVTTDGTVCDLPRTAYVKAEERVVEELKACNKPFVIVLNTTSPDSNETSRLKDELAEKYGVSVISLNVANMSESDMVSVFASILNEFPLTNICVKMPSWLQALPHTNKYIKEVIEEVYNATRELEKVGSDFSVTMFENSENFEQTFNKTIDMSNGELVIEIVPKENLFYKVLSDECGCDIGSDYALVSYVKQLAVAKTQYDKFKDAIDQVNSNGYGVVYPNMNDLILEEPEMVRQGGKFGVKLKATAPSLHIMRVDIETEVNPIVGSEQQTEEMAKDLQNEFANNPEGVWDTKIFGRSLQTLVTEGLQNKLVSMPEIVQKKMRKTLGRIVNEGKGGVICILL